MDKTEREESITWAQVVAGCLLKRDGRYLLVQEGKPKAYGLWNLPAGHVHKGESLEEAAVREVKEETGFTVTLNEPIGVFHDAIEKPIIHIFSADIVDGELQFNSEEILDAQWLTYDEIEALNSSRELRATWIWRVIQRDRSQN